MKFIKKEKGITLVALIITVIILLILSLVAIKSISGEKDIIGKAEEASDLYKQEANNENSYVENRVEYLNSNIGENIPVTGVRLDEETVDISVGESKTLTATIEPSTATNKKLIWTSDDEEIATVDDNGCVTVNILYDVIITVTTEDGNFSASCTINPGSCLAKGTKISMSDGLTKNIEEIKVGDSVLTYNHETGTYEEQEVYFVWQGEQSKQPFTLYFENGENISIVGEHDLFEKENLKYVTITEENVESFIGKHFFSATDGKFVELISVTKETEKTEFYSIYTKYNVNCIANGFLTVPDDMDYTLNIFDFYNDLTINHKQLAQDIEKYGLREYSKDLLYTKEEYDYVKIKYIDIAIGKGLIDIDGLRELRTEYLDCK